MKKLLVLLPLPTLAIVLLLVGIVLANMPEHYHHGVPLIVAGTLLTMVSIAGAIFLRKNRFFV